MPGMAKDMGGRAVDGRIAPAALLVGERPPVAEARQYESASDVLDGSLIQGEPGDGTDRARDEQESVREIMRGRA